MIIGSNKMNILSLKIARVGKVLMEIEFEVHIQIAIVGKVS